MTVPRTTKDVASLGPAQRRSWHSGQRRRRKVAESVARHIAASIVEEELHPGDVLPGEAEMVQAYGVARGSLREALRLLETQGLISVKPGPGGGPVLMALLPEHFAEIMKLHLQMTGATYGEVLQARLAIEPLTARLAADSADAEGFERLRQLLAEADRADLGDNPSYQHLSQTFHGLVGELSGNGVLSLLGESLKEVYDEQIHSSASPLADREQVRVIHRAIGEAIFAGDSVEAERLMSAHMTEFGAVAQAREPQRFALRVAWD